MWHNGGLDVAQCQFYDSYIVVNTTYGYDGKPFTILSSAKS